MPTEIPLPPDDLVYPEMTRATADKLFSLLCGPVPGLFDGERAHIREALARVAGAPPVTRGEDWAKLAEIPMAASVAVSTGRPQLLASVRVPLPDAQQRGLLWLIAHLIEGDEKWRERMREADRRLASLHSAVIGLPIMVRGLMAVNDGRTPDE